MSHLIAYGIRNIRRGKIDSYVFEALRRLRDEESQLVVLKPTGFCPKGDDLNELGRLADAVLDVDDLGSEPSVMKKIYDFVQANASTSTIDRVTWLDDSLFGPVNVQRGLPEIPVDAQGTVLVDQDGANGPEGSVLPLLSLRTTFMESAEFLRSLEGERCGYLEFVQRLRDMDASIATAHPRNEPHEVYFARDSIVRLRREGLNFVPISVFTRDPLVNDRWGIVPRETYDWMCEEGYPRSAIWNHLLLSVPPRTWYTNLSMAEIIPVSGDTSESTTLTTAVIVHVYYTDMARELIDLAATIPGPVRVIATTNTPEKQAELQEVIGSDPRFTLVEVRVVTSNRGRDISAFLVDCADVLRDPTVDLVVKLHSKRSVQDPASVSGWFRRHLFDNLFASPAYVRNIYGLFEQEPQLGMVFPPTIHMGLPTMGRAWSLNLGPAHNVAQRIGVRNPFDVNTPLSPYGSMFIARREVLLPLVEANFAIAEFPDAHEYRDGSLAHVLERLVSYVAFSHGYYAKTVQSAPIASVSEPFLEYKLQAVGEYMQAHTIEQVATLRGRGENWPLWQAVRRVVWTRLEDRVPGSGKWLSRGFALMGRVKSVARRAIKR